MLNSDLCFLGANLRELDISQTPNTERLTDAAVCAIATRCPNLRRFVANEELLSVVTTNRDY